MRCGRYGPCQKVTVRAKWFAGANSLGPVGINVRSVAFGCADAYKVAQERNLTMSDEDVRLIPPIPTGRLDLGGAALRLTEPLRCRRGQRTGRPVECWTASGTTQPAVESMIVCRALLSFLEGDRDIVPDTPVRVEADSGLLIPRQEGPSAAPCRRAPKMEPHD